MKALIWHEEQLGAKFDEVEIPDDLKAKAEELHTQLVEMAVEEDEDAVGRLSRRQDAERDAELKRCIRKGAIQFHFVPVMCGSAFKNKGVQPLLDAVVDYLPSPLDIPPVKGIVPGKTRKLNGPPTTRRRSPASPSRSWTTRLSAPSPLCASIPARFRRAPACSIRSRTRTNASAACC
jgi:translation elongation factor EF-G